MNLNSFSALTSLNSTLIREESSRCTQRLHSLTL
uniref:Uncharacterized protein n=1 Tax=Anguilla anguilla TaxID=7936 RepID=A0A0E9UFQ4_ANGAN